MSQICKYFGLCGGCDFQDMEYGDQLKMKEDRVKEIFSVFKIKEREKIVPSPEIYYYRNKMEYAITSDKEDILIGLRQKKRFYRIVDLDECRIFFDGVQSIFEVFKDWIKKNDIEPYQLRRHSGNVRYAAMRHSKYYNELMVTAVIATEEDRTASLVESLKSIDAVRSVYVCVNNGLADLSVTGNLKLAYGENRIKERINNIDYLISANSFFQTNPYCCASLYSIINEETKDIGGDALDMCCGSGGITLQISDNFNKVTGADISAQNIEDALLNASLNKKENIEFMCVDAEKFKDIKKFSTVILDPPRAGLGRKIKEALLTEGAENVVYVSCNPVNLAEDLKTLTSAYRIEKIMPVDMFPHTRHVEVIAILKRDKV